MGCHSLKKPFAILLLVFPLLLALMESASGESEKKKGEPSKPITITANRMEANRKLRIVNYIDNVIVKKEDFTINAKKMEILFDEKMKEIQRITAEGSVRYVDSEKTATAEKAVYFSDQDMLILTGNPKIWQGDNVISWSKMTLLRKEDRSLVEGDEKERVTSIFYPSQDAESSKKGTLQIQGGKSDQGKPSRTKDKP